ncbi:C-glycoside deglycosidase beta subunit domain-containing protein [Listeria costaricensis]|uniref:C-glycoside deglycosidase beta subunit domain-containing protein n=1 Tax=Listeria costaricensis TaxID=2026604 RepID=UPI000C07BDB6|nr:DUF6379 domain-containing protein [Listeria costaricensis]
MFDNNVFIEGTCRNVSEGFELKTHITYYRGIPLSMINHIAVTVDDVPVPREAIRFTVDEIDWFTLDELPTVTFYKWEYGQAATVRVLQPDGLAKGSHEVKLQVVTRTAYIPIPLAGEKTRTVQIS